MNKRRENGIQREEPTYIKLYLDRIGKFEDVQINLNPILAEMLKYASRANKKDENGGMVLALNKYLKEVIAEHCGVSLSRVDHAITEFVQKGYMRRVAVGTYQFNPFLFGKGEWTNLKKTRAAYDSSMEKTIPESTR